VNYRDIARAGAVPVMVALVVGGCSNPFRTRTAGSRTALEGSGHQGVVASSIAPDIPDIEMPQNCVRLYDGELPVCYEVVNGLAIVGGDIVIGTAGQMSALRENRETGKWFRRQRPH